MISSQGYIIAEERKIYQTIYKSMQFILLLIEIIKL